MQIKSLGQGHDATNLQGIGVITIGDSVQWYNHLAICSTNVRKHRQQLQDENSEEKIIDFYNGAKLKMAFNDVRKLT